MVEIWLWQDIVSPHMAGLAAALAARGVQVVYVAEQELSEDRVKLGWALPELAEARLEIAPTAAAVCALVEAAPINAVHICQGIRGNALVGVAQKQLAKRHLQYWVVMETVHDEGWRGALKRIVYTALFRLHRSRIAGVLATGWRTPGWVVDRGMARERVFPFAYFLPDRPDVAYVAAIDGSKPYRIAYIGQFIERKRLSLLIDALADLPQAEAELVVAGSGPLEQDLRKYAQTRLKSRLCWMGRLPSLQVSAFLGEVDCLVLPSQHDGWGAVVSEALMSGAVAICSDGCGAAGVVEASGVGDVFSRDDPHELKAMLMQTIAAGRLSAVERAGLARWAKSLAAEAGAQYLLDILAHTDGLAPRPQAPWIREG